MYPIHWDEHSWKLVKRRAAASKFQENLEMYQSSHTPGKPHLNFAIPLNNLGSVQGGLGKLENALEKHKRSLEMYQRFYGHDKLHPDIARLLTHTADLRYGQRNLVRAAEAFERSNEMLRIVDVARSAHLSSCAVRLGRRVPSSSQIRPNVTIHEQDLGTDRTIREHDWSHVDIARGLHIIVLQ